MRAAIRKYLFALVAVLLVGSFAATVHAQSRLGDKDVEHLMSNLRDDVKKFRNPYESALKHSAFRKTSQEKAARALAEQLERDTDKMLSTFQKKRKANEVFAAVFAVAQKVDAVVQQLEPQSSAFSEWTRVQSDLSALRPAFAAASDSQ